MDCMVLGVCDFGYVPCRVVVNARGKLSIFHSENRWGFMSTGWPIRNGILSIATVCLSTILVFPYSSMFLRPSYTLCYLSFFQNFVKGNCGYSSSVSFKKKGIVNQIIYLLAGGHDNFEWEEMTFGKRTEHAQLLRFLVVKPIHRDSNS